MAESNERIIEELTKEVENSHIESVAPPFEDDSNEFHDAEGPPSEHNSVLNDSDDEISISEEEDLSRNETELSGEEIEKLRKESLELKEKGNDLFRSGSHSEACHMYSKALKCCPSSLPLERAILYNNRAAAKTKLEKKESALKDCIKAVDLNPTYTKALLRRAKLYEELGQLDKALADFKELDKMDPNNPEVKAALATLPRRIEEQTEKLKAEMLSKMKDLGNMFLRPFGLSTDNFQLKQDPTTGSYSVNMSK